MEIACHRSAATTVFENIYLDDGRKQILHQRADVITCDQIPPAWRNARMVYLGPSTRRSIREYSVALVPMCSSA